jgi:hypothetical protein
VASRVRAGKSPIRPAKGHTADSALGGIIAEANASIIKEAGEGGPTAQAVVDRLGDLAFRRDAIPCLRATSATFAPAANVSATILAFSSADQWHRGLPLFKISTCIRQ